MKKRRIPAMEAEQAAWVKPVLVQMFFRLVEECVVGVS
jgi:hypothetical protein